MRAAWRSAAALAILGISCIVLPGCMDDDDRKPVPVIVIMIEPQERGYLLNGKAMYLSDLQSALQDLADKYRRPITGDARAMVHVYYAPSIPWPRVQEVLVKCQNVGLDQVTADQRETPPKPPTTDP